MYDLPTNQQENETREQRVQVKTPERRESELQEFARKLDRFFASVGV